MRAIRIFNVLFIFPGIISLAGDAAAPSRNAVAGVVPAHQVLEAGSCGSEWGKVKRAVLPLSEPADSRVI